MLHLLPLAPSRLLPYLLLLPAASGYFSARQWVHILEVLINVITPAKMRESIMEDQDEFPIRKSEYEEVGLETNNKAELEDVAS